MAEIVPPVPYKTPLADNTGFVSEPWSKWFRQAFSRIGGPVALTNLELATLQTSDISAVQTVVSTLQSQVASLNTAVSALKTSMNDIDQRPFL